MRRSQVQALAGAESLSAYQLIFLHFLTIFALSFLEGLSVMCIVSRAVTCDASVLSTGAGRRRESVNRAMRREPGKMRQRIEKYYSKDGLD